MTCTTERVIVTWTAVGGLSVGILACLMSRRMKEVDYGLH